MYRDIFSQNVDYMARAFLAFCIENITFTNRLQRFIPLEITLIMVTINLEYYILHDCKLSN